MEDFVKKKILTYGILSILFLVLLILLSIINFKNKYFERNSFKLNLESIDKLMIVAHPDDEILWGGEKLIQENFLVVCITCGSNKERVKEFKSVMSKTDDAFIMLNYPDKTLGKRNNWKSVKFDIIKDLKTIYNLKNWKQIVTHNPEGEYGHIHHKMTSQFVTEIVDKNKLMYFGKYYSKKDIQNQNITLKSLPEGILKKKREILKIYSSQENTINSFEHMYISENPLSYDDWRKKYDEKD